MQTGIEAAGPTPSIDVNGDAGALADGADADVVIEDVPCDLVRIVGATAG
jgi:hypothetical protein